MVFQNLSLLSEAVPGALTKVRPQKVTPSSFPSKSQRTGFETQPSDFLGRTFVSAPGTASDRRDKFWKTMFPFLDN